MFLDNQVEVERERQEDRKETEKEREEEGGGMRGMHANEEREEDTLT